MTNSHELENRKGNNEDTCLGLLCFYQVGKILKIPVIKFLLHSASYLWFLITLLGESITMEMYRDKFASRQQDILHNSFHMVWVVGGFTPFCENEISCLEIVKISC